MKIDPQMALAVAELEETMRQAPPWHTLDPAELRRQLDEGLLWPAVYLPQAQERTIPGPAGPIPIRVFTPDTVRGVFLHFHGGGWVIGSARMQDEFLWARANAAQVALVSVDYRLAPEHPHPAAPDDCEAAALWLVENAASDFGSDRIVVGGESAGAQLAAVTLQRLRDRHGYTGIRGAVLNNGVFDLRHTPSSRLWGDRPLIINTPTMRWYVDLFTAGQSADDPDLSPLLGRLHDMPPAIFTVGTLDPLLDDSLFMAARWQATRSEVELRIFPGACHGFDIIFSTPASQEAAAAVSGFVGRCLAD